MVMRTLVGAHYGIGQWLGQRITAVIITLYLLFAAIALALVQPADHYAWKALFTATWMRIPTVLFFLSLCFHSWVGVRDILMDYVKPVGLRLLLHSAVGISLAWYAVWVMQILWRD